MKKHPGEGQKETMYQWAETLFGRKERDRKVYYCPQMSNMREENEICVYVHEYLEGYRTKT